jgi:hypothetical protein
MPNRLSDMIFDEVSLVYKGANQHSRVAIAKSDDGVEQEEAMGYTDQDGNPVDVNSLEEGDVVFDEDGQGFVYTEQELDDDEVEYEEEPALVGKNFPVRQTGQQESSFQDDVRWQLSKAITDEDRDEVISKAAGYISHLENLVHKAQADVETEREIRREAEYMEIAKSYGGLPVNEEALAAALMDCADNLDESSIVTLQKCLSAASDSALMEIGSSGGGFNSDVMAVIEEHANQGVSKNADTTPEAEIAKAFESDPTLYSQYLNETGGYNSAPRYQF